MQFDHNVAIEEKYLSKRELDFDSDRFESGIP